MEGLGLLATCNPMGAGKWRERYAETLRKRSVVIITDNDPPTDEKSNPHYKGQKHAAYVAASLLRHSCEVRIIEPPRGKDEINALASAQVPFTPDTLASWTKR